MRFAHLSGLLTSLWACICRIKSDVLACNAVGALNVNGFILEYARSDVNSPGGSRVSRYIVVAESTAAAFAIVGDWGIRRRLIDDGPAVLKQARELGLNDNESRPLKS